MKSGLLFKAVICVLLCLGLGIGSGFVAGSATTSWYQSLNKPFFQPPSWIFGPAWTLLYTLMGIALARIWHSDSPAKNRAMLLFATQFILNLVWSPVFFKMEQITVALVIIIALLLLVILTARHFMNIDRVAGRLLIPYILWLCFATLLNAAIVHLN